ncbi:hypothetical protein [Candidatus Aalborgicola defluviihabitans]|uniref:hypothetical protein n=1 Tax=Candidatus Aalborgicola defluviihabitans TaxID=3386187 RepID=UPI001DCFC30F|nr:hypothetical protein [Burkholderiales bacterium]
MQKGKLRVLNLEDSPNDSELIEAEFAAAFEDVEFFRVQTRAAFTEALEVFKPDVILCDYKLPDFDGLTALKIVRQTHPEPAMSDAMGGTDRRGPRTVLKDLGAIGA